MNYFVILSFHGMLLLLKSHSSCTVLSLVAMISWKVLYFPQKWHMRFCSSCGCYVWHVSFQDIRRFLNRKLWNFVAFYVLWLNLTRRMQRCCTVSQVNMISDVKVVYQFFCFLHPFAFIQLNIYLIDIKFATLILLSCCPNDGALRLCYLYKQS